MPAKTIVSAAPYHPLNNPNPELLSDFDFDEGAGVWVPNGTYTITATGDGQMTIARNSGAVNGVHPVTVPDGFDSIPLVNGTTYWMIIDIAAMSHTAAYYLEPSATTISATGKTFIEFTHDTADTNFYLEATGALDAVVTFNSVSLKAKP